MSFISKLLDSFFGKSEDKYVRDYKGKNEFKIESDEVHASENDSSNEYHKRTENQIDNNNRNDSEIESEKEEDWRQFTLAEVLPKIKDFCGIDLTEAPNYEWKEEDPEYNAQNVLVRNYTFSATHRLHHNFLDAEAKVIGKEGTDFFFETCDIQEQNRDLYYFIESEIKKRDITFEEAATEAHKYIGNVSYFKDFSMNLEVVKDFWEHRSLRMSISTNLYNGKYIELKEAPKPKVPVVTPEGYTLPYGYVNLPMRLKIELAQLPFFNECLWMHFDEPTVFEVISRDGKIEAVDRNTLKTVLPLEGDMLKEHLDKGEKVTMICSEVKYGEEYLEMNTWFRFCDPSEEEEEEDD